MIRWLERHFEEAICGICLCVIAACVMLQVILRYLFAAAAPWAEEIAVYGMIFAVYLGASLAIRERSHIRITLLIEHLPRRLAVAAVVLADLLWCGFLILMVYLTSLYTRLLFEVTYISPGLGLEQKWFQLVIPATLVLMLLRMLQVYWRWGRDGFRGLPL